MQFKLPEPKRERTEMSIRQQSALRGMRMDVDIPRHVETKHLTLRRSVEAESIRTETSRLKVRVISLIKHFASITRVSHHRDVFRK